MHTGFLIAMILGIISTSCLQLAQSMERHGIEIFDQIRAKLKKTGEEFKGGSKKPTIYIIGVIFNQTPTLWAILANLTGAPSSYYTSVFGIGLLVTMTYSARILKEPITRIEYAGAAVLIAGTLLIGIDGIFRPELSMADIDLTGSFITIGVFAMLGFTGMIIGLKNKSPVVIGILFGLFSGGIGALDPVLKGIGQNYRGAGGLPTDVVGWLIFLVSFGAGAGAFSITQWGFARKANASKLIPSYNSTYVVLPIVIQIIALPGFVISGMLVIGVVIAITGIVMITAFKQRPPPHHGITSDDAPAGTEPDA